MESKNRWSLNIWAIEPTAENIVSQDKENKNKNTQEVLLWLSHFELDGLTPPPPHTHTHSQKWELLPDIFDFNFELDGLSTPSPDKEKTSHG